MSQKLSPQELRVLRNNLPLRDVLYALRIPWKVEEQRCRFRCPVCKGLETSLHPKENLGRCFVCGRNFNPIDLVMACHGRGFMTAVDWLRALRNLSLDEGYQTMITSLALASKMK